MIIKAPVYDDLAAAYKWYENVESGLGQRLLDDFEKLLSTIQFAPRAFHIVYRGCRRARMDVFPYYIHYLLENEIVTIISVDHTSRDPKEWKRRIRARS